MKYLNLLSACSLFFCSFAFLGPSNETKFDPKKDLLLANFDCKTDVDDLHTAAALATLLANKSYSKINYHAISGTYGTQEGLYVPPNELMQLAFGNNWSDAHNQMSKAVEKVNPKVKKVLKKGGDIWVAEAGQSDFTALLIKTIIAEMPQIDIKSRIHVVQHSDWNEKVTTKESLNFVKQHADYHKIPDGNVVGNGSPGFLDANFTKWDSKIKDPKLEQIWSKSISISNQYNGQEGRYKNKSIAAGGLDFSDLSEVCYIFGLQDIKNVEEFFERFGR